jgi:hypothetical protein
METRTYPIFNKCPAEYLHLVEAAIARGAANSNMLKASDPTPQATVKSDTPTIEDSHSLKQYAREVVAANESNGYRMSIGTFLDLWRKN